MDKHFATAVAELCINKFQQLPKSGKPQAKEWTVLAAVVKIRSNATLPCRTSPLHGLPGTTAATWQQQQALGGTQANCSQNCSPNVDVAVETAQSDAMEVVALGTGSKCLGTARWCRRGALVHDSHAEVVAKRSFQLYLMDQVESAYREDCSSIFAYSPGTADSDASAGVASQDYSSSNEDDGPNLSLKEGISFSMFVSHTPCGDCSIFPKQFHTSDGDLANGNHDTDNKSQTYNLHVDGVPCSEAPNCFVAEPVKKKIKTDNEQTTSNSPAEQGSTRHAAEHDSTSHTAEQRSSGYPAGDIHRTGAKCAAGEQSDLHMPSSGYHRVGPLRTKPGRGHPTLSHSCSDKMLKWNLLGMQGSLLMAFIKCPIYLDHIIIGSCPYNQEAMQRGIFGRYSVKLLTLHLENGFRVTEPKLMKCDVCFALSRDEVQKNLRTDTVTPCPASISWHPGYGCRKSQVLVDGRKIGVTKKNINSTKSQVAICKLQMMNTIVGLHGIKTLKINNSAADAASVNNELAAVTYRQLKDLSINYRITWKLLRKYVFTNWTAKPDNLQDFNCESTNLHIN